MTKVLQESGIEEFIVHTGQHYDDEMSQIFFDELNLPEPDINLGVGSGGHGWQTGQILIKLEQILEQEKPDLVLVYGDTNSTLGGALGAVKLNIPLAHVEAGLRSYNRKMAEEHNRVLTDHCADLLFCPTQTAIKNLMQEGINKGIHLVGDTMYDAVLQYSEIAERRSTIIQDMDLEYRGFILATVHRPYNTDNPVNLKAILSAFLEVNEAIVFPVHPRARRKISELDNIDIKLSQSKVRLIPPLGYLDMLCLEQSARLILTDSGGIQKEAYFFGTPCITLRRETEWTETVEAGWNVLVGASQEKILEMIGRHELPGSSRDNLFGDGQAARKIVNLALQSI